MKRRLPLVMPVVALLLACLAASHAAARTAALPIEGAGYRPIPEGQPLATVDGRIEVAEFCNDVCPACDASEPALAQWRAKLPADVHLVEVPARFRPGFEPYANAYSAADSLGLGKRTHEAV
jgi:thiol:disulfide interchange protein DsbA